MRNQPHESDDWTAKCWRKQPVVTTEVWVVRGLYMGIPYPSIPDIVSIHYVSRGKYPTCTRPPFPCQFPQHPWMISLELPIQASLYGWNICNQPRKALQFRRGELHWLCRIMAGSKNFAYKERREAFWNHAIKSSLPAWSLNWTSLTCKYFEEVQSQALSTYKLPILSSKPYLECVTNMLSVIGTASTPLIVAQSFVRTVQTVRKVNRWQWPQGPVPYTIQPGPL